MSDNPSSFLKYEQTGHVVTLTMSQPESRNALTGNSAIPEFLQACARINADRSVRVMVLTGSGTVFCSGGNVKDMRRHIAADYSPDLIRDEYRQGIQRLALAVYGLEVPSIAAVNGPAVGAGCDLTCMCDIRIAAESASFAESFVRLGLVAGDGGAWLLPRAVGWSRAAEMTFTGASLSSAEALACNLVSRVVPDGELQEAAKALADRIAVNPGTALRMSKRLLRESQHLRLPDVLEMAAGMQSLAVKTPQHAEAVSAFVGKRPPLFPD
jgi:enoyl-CoA hydratase/carnithine racemase